VNFRKQERRNDTHQSLTDPEALLYRVGWMFTFAAAANNLVRMRNLQAATA
jgi:hypothetical protein